MSDGDHHTAMTAAVAVARVGGSGAMPVLLDMLDAEPAGSPASRAAARAIAVLGPSAREAVAPLIRLLLSAGVDDWSLSDYRSALVAIGKAAVEPLIAALLGSPRDSPGPVICAQTLAALKDDAVAAVPHVIALLDLPDANARLGVLAALRDFGPHAAPAVPQLVRLLGLPLSPTSSDAQRNAASMALAQIGAAAVPALIDALRTGSQSLRGMSVETLAAIGPDARAAVSALIDALGETGLEHRWIRNGAMKALGAIGPDARAAVPALTAAITADPERRLSAIHALGRIGPDAKSAVDVIRRQLELLRADEAKHARDLIDDALRAIEGE